MLVELMHGRNPPIRLPAGQVILRGDQGTVVAVAAEINGSIQIYRVGDANFQQVLANLGLAPTQFEYLPVKPAHEFVPAA